MEWYLRDGKCPLCCGELSQIVGGQHHCRTCNMGTTDYYKNRAFIDIIVALRDRVEVIEGVLSEMDYDV